MKKEHEKMMMDLQRMLATQDFKSEDQIKTFMAQIMGKKLPSFPTEALSIQEQAEDLVMEAYELPASKAKANVEKALQLDPDCIQAYEYLGSLEKTAERAASAFEKGIAIGRKKFGGKYLKEHMGMFWGFHETRPFMRCLHSYADCLYAMGKVKECVAILEEMILLNPSDNQGARDHLMLYLILLDENEKFTKYAKMYKDGAMSFSLFNRALFAFKTQGDTPDAAKKLHKALENNKFVAKRLIANKMILNLPEYYGIGDDDEAKFIVQASLPIWNKTKGAIDWLKKYSKKW